MPRVVGLDFKQSQPEPAPPRVPSTVAELLAQASSAERGDELLRAYWEDYATNHENRALDAFNSKPKKGIELAIADGLCVEEARSIAEFLLRAPGLDKTQVCRPPTTHSRTQTHAHLDNTHRTGFNRAVPHAAVACIG